MAKDEVRTMVAVRKCWHGKKIYNIGDPIVVPVGGKVPRHFIDPAEFGSAAVKKAAAEDKKNRSVKVKAEKAPKE